MFKIITTVKQGILFIRLQGRLTDNNFYEFSDEVNYLLYNQGISYFVFNFDDLDIERNIFSKIQNKLIEICLRSGKVILCGLNEDDIKKVNFDNEDIKFVGSEIEALNYLTI